jgi:hypothetical protein
MRSLRVVAVALAALIVGGAILASASSADELTAESYPVLLTGRNSPSSLDTYITTAGTVACKSVSYVGTITGATTTVSITPSYSNCTFFGFPAVVDVNECKLTTNIGAGTTGDGDLSCPAGKSLTVTAITAGTTKCTLHMSSQSDMTGTVTLSNTGSGTTRELHVRAQLSGVDYTHTKGTGLGACAAGSGTNGSLEVTALVTGEADKEGGPAHIGLFLS